ncbi:hypothetical protein BDY19DRAFT_175203 [Irpex rosettiformis]|uniref:Uncharacterized protein n=1 Tax=Irpex rosettiformis TaxID=378272 RepID=A0ACB8U398_9APHY|nr:hypothetical protein BDY19DRAFT_175203 [Irpex rosettiformis]
MDCLTYFGIVRHYLGRSYISNNISIRGIPLAKIARSSAGLTDEGEQRSFVKLPFELVFLHCRTTRQSSGSDNDHFDYRGVMYKRGCNARSLRMMATGDHQASCTGCISKMKLDKELIISMASNYNQPSRTCPDSRSLTGCHRSLRGPGTVVQVLPDRSSHHA